MKKWYVCVNAVLGKMIQQDRNQRTPTLNLAPARIILQIRQSKLDAKYIPMYISK